jgi:hypothetical protein
MTKEIIMKTLKEQRVELAERFRVEDRAFWFICAE